MKFGVPICSASPGAICVGGDKHTHAQWSGLGAPPGRRRQRLLPGPTAPQRPGGGPPGGDAGEVGPVRPPPSPAAGRRWSGGLARALEGRGFPNTNTSLMLVLEYWLLRIANSRCSGPRATARHDCHSLCPMPPLLCCLSGPPRVLKDRQLLNATLAQIDTELEELECALSFLSVKRPLPPTASSLPSASSFCFECDVNEPV